MHVTSTEDVLTHTVGAEGFRRMFEGFRRGGGAALESVACTTSGTSEADTASIEVTLPFREITEELEAKDLGGPPGRPPMPGIATMPGGPPFASFI